MTAVNERSELKKTGFDIRSVMFEEDGGVVIQYMHLPNDVRARGALTATHTLAVADGEAWAEEIREVRVAALNLLVDAVEDFEEATPVDMEDIFEPDPTDERGMGE